MNALDMEDFDSFYVDDLVSVQCDRIDRTHRKLLTGFAECSRILGAGSEAELAAAGRRLMTLLDDLERHCAREERLLRAAGYAQVEQHRDAHEALCTYLREAAIRLERDGTPVEAEIILEQGFARLLTHFNTTDVLYKGCISDERVPSDPPEVGGS